MIKTLMMHHARKINRVMTILLGITVLVIYFAPITSNQAASSYISLIFLLLGALAAGTSLLLKRFERSAAFVVFLACLTANLNVVLTNKHSLAIIGIVMSLIVAALYLQKWLFLWCDGVMTAAIVILQMMTHVMAPSDFITSLVFIEISGVLLFFLTQYGQELLKQSESESTKAAEAMEKIRNHMNVISDSTLSLNQNINQCNEHLESVKKVSNDMATTVQEVSKGITGQADSIKQINQKMGQAEQMISETAKLSTELTGVTMQTSRLVEDSSTSVNQMNDQIAIINSAASKSLVTVKGLLEDMEEVQNFISGIAKIAKKTNLLALNAAIEASQAGEAGSGFMVVAEEVKNLAEQSSETATRIIKIITEIKEKTGAVLNEVENENIAIQKGDQIAGQVYESFEKIKTAFTQIDQFITNEQQKIETTNQLFSDINQEVQSIASIAQEQAAAAEEMLAITEEHKSTIATISHIMDGIHQTSNELSRTIEQN